MATRRCNDGALPRIGEALNEANRVWKDRNQVVHATWAVCPSLLGGTCEVATSLGEDLEEDEYHVERSTRGKSDRIVEHRNVGELEELVMEFESARQELIAALKEFNPQPFE